MAGYTDALGNEVTLSLDGAGNIIIQTDKRGHDTEFVYDMVLNRPVSYKDRTGAITSYEYDRNGNMVKVKYPDKSTVTYTYDKAGRMVSTTARNGLVTELSYDGCGNIIRIQDDETRVQIRV